MLTIALGARFVLELGALLALAVWGFAAAGSTPGRLLLGIGLPLAVAVIWGAFVGPGSTSPAAVKAVLQLVIFGAAAAALAATRSTALAGAFIAAVAVDAAVMAAVED
jgi:uncharacterized protein DUF2568